MSSRHCRNGLPSTFFYRPAHTAGLHAGHMRRLGAERRHTQRKSPREAAEKRARLRPAPPRRAWFSARGSRSVTPSPARPSHPQETLPRPAHLPRPAAGPRLLPASASVQLSLGPSMDSDEEGTRERAADTPPRRNRQPWLLPRAAACVIAQPARSARGVTWPAFRGGDVTAFWAGSGARLLRAPEFPVRTEPKSCAQCGRARGEPASPGGGGARGGEEAALGGTGRGGPARDRMLVRPVPRRRTALLSEAQSLSFSRERKSLVTTRARGSSHGPECPPGTRRPLSDHPAECGARRSTGAA